MASAGKPENTGTTTRESQEILMYDVTGGTITTTHLNLPLPSNANDFLPDATLKVDSRLFMSMTNNDGITGTILTYDLSASPWYSSRPGETVHHDKLHHYRKRLELDCEALEEHNLTLTPSREGASLPSDRLTI